MKIIFRISLRSFSLLALVGLIGLIIGIVSFPKAVWAKSVVSTLHVDGRNLVNGCGQSIVLKGLNIEFHNWAYDNSTYDPNNKKWNLIGEANLIDEMQYINSWALTDEDMKRMKKWGANVIRLQVPHYFFESINTPGIYFKWAFDKLNEWILLAAENGMYVIIDLHVPYGGRQYVSPDTQEGKTLWLNESEKLYVQNLWQQITISTEHHSNVLYELMNEPYPKKAGKTDEDWWIFAQTLIDVIRENGAEQIIIVANPLPEGGFKKLSDSLNSIAYDFHFYLPYEFTHQQAYWMDEPYPSTSYPYSYFINDWNTISTYDHDETDFTGSKDWTLWQETFSTTNEMSNENPTHIRPVLSSYNNIGKISFDNVKLYIDDVQQSLSNPTFEKVSGDFPDDWEQTGNESTDPAIWEQEEPNGNRFITIPSTDEGKSRSVFPGWGIFVKLPEKYNEIRVEADVRGENQDKEGQNANVFGMHWIKPIQTQKLYDKNQMESDIEKYIKFGDDNNVPMMCLEFGVIMAASEEQGHLTWLADFSSLLNEKGTHGAYHLYRVYDDNPAHKSFGIYQCWGRQASECTEKKFEFVIPVLTNWFNNPQIKSRLEVTILPQEVITAGVKWQVDGGVWQDSGDSISGLCKGSHTIVFRDIVGWTKPNIITVDIQDGETAKVNEFYTINQYQATITSTPGGSTDKDGTNTISHGGSITIMATPAEGYGFTGWSGDGKGSINPLVMEQITKTSNITANFAIKQYKVSFKNHDGTELKSEMVNHGSGATAPDNPTRDNYRFTGWDVFNKITANLEVRAQYVRQYTLNYTTKANGSLTGISPQTVDHGTNGTSVKAIPDKGYRLVRWSDGITVNPRRDINVTDNINVDSVFDYFQGDVNLNGIIDIGDVILMIRYASGQIELTELQKRVGNITGQKDNNNVGILDAMKILSVFNENN